MIIKNHHYHAPAKANELFRSLATSVEQLPVVIFLAGHESLSASSEDSFVRFCRGTRNVASGVLGRSCALASLRSETSQGTGMDFAEDAAI